MVDNCPFLLDWPAILFLPLILLLHYCSSLPTFQLLSFVRTSRSVLQLITKRFLSLACQILVMVKLRLPIVPHAFLSIQLRSIRAPFVIVFAQQLIANPSHFREINFCITCITYLCKLLHTNLYCFTKCDAVLTDDYTNRNKVLSKWSLLFILKCFVNDKNVIASKLSPSD